MAGAINLTPTPYGTADGGSATFSLLFDDQGRFTALAGTNTPSPTGSASAKCRVVGWAADGTEDPNKEFVLVLGPGVSDQVTIPVNGPKAFGVQVNARGKQAGFNTYLG